MLTPQHVLRLFTPTSHLALETREALGKGNAGPGAGWSVRAFPASTGPRSESEQQVVRIINDTHQLLTQAETDRGLGKSRDSSSVAQRLQLLDPKFQTFVS